MVTPPVPLAVIGVLPAQYSIHTTEGIRAPEVS